MLLHQVCKIGEALVEPLFVHMHEGEFEVVFEAGRKGKRIATAPGGMRRIHGKLGFDP